MSFSEYMGLVRRKGKPYWIRLILFVVVGVSLSSWVVRWDAWIDIRYLIYQKLQHLGPRQAYERDTSFVLIQDEEYWKGGVRRVPIRRDYLAKLVAAVDSADAAVIVLDFDLRSAMPEPTPGVPLEPPQYEAETLQLVEAVKMASQNRTVVLPRTVNKIGGRWIYESDVLDTFDLGRGRIVRGFIALPHDMREMPMNLPLPDGVLDSISLAAAKAKSKKEVKDFLESLPKMSSAPFAGYLDESEFEKNVVPAGLFLRDSLQFKDSLAHKIVIIGGAWSTLAYQRGRTVDTYATPAGLLPGAFIHANYIEAFLDRRVYTPTKEWVAWSIESLLVFSVALAFLYPSRGARLVIIVLILISTGVISYVAFINFGVFFDFFIPLLFVGAHGVLEIILEWRNEALLYRRMIYRAGAVPIKHASPVSLSESPPT